MQLYFPTHGFREIFKRHFSSNKFETPLFRSFYRSLGWVIPFPHLRLHSKGLFKLACLYRVGIQFRVVWCPSDNFLQFQLTSPLMSSHKKSEDFETSNHQNSPEQYPIPLMHHLLDFL